MVAVTDFSIGQIITGTISGIQPYGIFVDIAEGQQGLIHISEIDNTYITDINEKFAVGDKVTVKIIDIDEYTNKMSLSLRAMHPVPIPDKPPRIYAPRRKQQNTGGFAPLGKAMGAWTTEALADIASGKIKDYRMED